LIRQRGLEAFYDQEFARHFDRTTSPPEREKYLDDWAREGALEAMLSWYAASQLVVPTLGLGDPPPDWLNRPFPKTRMPVAVIWGKHDKALLVDQLEDLGSHVPDLTIVRLDAGHFVTWEAPEAVTRTIYDFLSRSPGSA
jgi:pimeloyl-ACP methyl ester carboxylesterase